jgi:Bacterial Ig domain/Purple acid Phosphatase, N-terminal domain/Fibronectin type III domain
VIGRLALLCALALLLVVSLGTEPLEVSFAAQITGTPTRTASGTASPTPRQTSTRTATSTTTPSPTSTTTIAQAAQQPTSGLAIITATPTPVRTSTPTPTGTATRVPTPTSTATPNPTASPSQTPTQTVTPTAVPATITDVGTSSITRSSATISWTTSQPATSQVAYGLQQADSHTPVDASLVTAHRVVLTNLQPGAIYQFQVLSATAQGSVATSISNAVTTAPAGSGPEIADLEVQQATSTTATLNWATSTGTVAQVEFGPTANYGSFTLLNVFAGPAQQLTVSDLKPATTYHWRVKAWDASGALGASPDATFSTAPAGPATLLGDTTVQTDRLALPGGNAALFQYVASQTGQASVVHVYVEAGTTAPVLRAALYSDQNGLPGVILSQGSAPALAAGWIPVMIPTVPLLESHRYWVGVLNPLGTGSLGLRESPGGGSSLASAQASLAAFPQPLVPGVAGAHSPLAAYVEQVPPAITLMSPKAGSIITGTGQLSAVIDDDVPLTRVQFYVDGQPVGAPLSSPPFAVAWNTTALSALLPHTITARASDALGRTGASRPVAVQIDNGAVISSVTVANGLTATSMQVTWLTNVAADSQVEYGPTSAYGLSTPLDSQLELRHDLQLTGLTPGTVYHYRVRSRDANGALATSADATFFTAE